MSHFHWTNILTHPVAPSARGFAPFMKRGGKAACGLRGELFIKYDIISFLLPILLNSNVISAEQPILSTFLHPFWTEAEIPHQYHSFSSSYLSARYPEIQDCRDQILFRHPLS